MFLLLLAIFIIVPLLELLIIFLVGAHIGFLLTFLILILISAAGAALSRRQGYRALIRIQEEVSQGRIPGDAIIDGALILAGALLLLTPGFLTDALGLLVLFPPARAPFRAWAKRRLGRAAARRTVFFWSRATAPGSPGPEPEQRRKELKP